ncbi:MULTISPECIES: hypothetical protein [Streptococcus]|uniref:hypothetical protein n=1 Tax=Streptococcus TaxID=1301 RepID=UPI00097C1599|nr:MULTISPECIES: hypothetical protein [Streptococcus]MBF0776472.1 hypothetical protein [Streptococcus sp. 19428wD3_AN2]ONK26821.1 hypothetical protein BVE85_07475 [Streptococcus azizii]TFU82949.1 hypothetical protein E4T83_06775 [Streptococcus sp. AN2]
MKINMILGQLFTHRDKLTKPFNLDGVSKPKPWMILCNHEAVEGKKWAIEPHPSVSWPFAVA